MKRGGPEHPKTKRLARLLRVRQPEAVGMLEMLFHWTYRYAPAGDVGRLDDGDIADGMGWHGDSAELIKAMTEAGWLDAVEDGRLYVHDWHDHADDAVHMALARETRMFANGDMPRLSRFANDERARISNAYAQQTHGKHTENAPPSPLSASHPPSSQPLSSQPTSSPPSPSVAKGMHASGQHEQASGAAGGFANAVGSEKARLSERASAQCGAPGGGRLQLNYDGDDILNSLLPDEQWRIDQLINFGIKPDDGYSIINLITPDRFDSILDYYLNLDETPKKPLAWWKKLCLRDSADDELTLHGRQVKALAEATISKKKQWGRLAT